MRPTTVSFDNMGDRAYFLSGLCNIYGEESNTTDFSELKRSMKQIVDNELTSVQREFMIEYYFNGKNIPQIAKERGINKSTVSRSLKVAREKIGNILRYGSWGRKL